MEVEYLELDGEYEVIELPEIAADAGAEASAAAAYRDWFSEWLGRSIEEIPAIHG